MAWSIIPARCGVPIASRRSPNTECITGGFPPSAPVPQKYSRGTGRRNLNAAELFSYTLNFEVWWLSAVGGISRLGRCLERVISDSWSLGPWVPPSHLNRE